MLLISRIFPTLSDEEQHLSSRIPIPPRTTSRPTDQRSGELKMSALESSTTPTIEEHDIAFSLVTYEPDVQPTSPNPTPTTTTPSLPLKGASTMHIKQFHQGSCVLHLFTTDLALLALVLRHATSNEYLQTLTPLIPTTLDSLATAFETGTLLGLQQTGHFRVEGEAILTAEQVQAWCQRVVVEGIDGNGVPDYSTEGIVDSGVSGGRNEE